MAITWADVEAAFPNDATLSAVDGAEEGATYVAWVDEQVSDAVLGTRADQVRILLCAHFATLVATGGSGAAGPIASESVDGVSRSYAVATSSTATDDLGATSYGRRAALLMRTTPRARIPRMI